MIKSPEDDVLKHDEFIFTLTQKRMYDELDRGDKLDSKASSLITLSGALSGFFLGIVTNQFKALSAIPRYEVVIMFVGVASLLASVFYSLRAMRVRKWDVVPDPRVLIDTYKTKHYFETLRPVTGEMANVQAEMLQTNNKKADYVDASWNLLLGGLGITFIFVIIVLL